MRVRDDDVLLIGKGFDHQQAVERFKEVHALIVAGGAIHVAALVCSTLSDFPGAITFLQEQYQNGTLIPEIHGWEHIDYGPLSQNQIQSDLNRCITLIQAAFGYTPTKFYTPWGASAPHISDAAQAVGLEMVDTSRVLYPKKKIFAGKMKDHYSKAVISEEQELFVHWWEDRWFGEKETHSLADTLAIIRAVAEKS